MDYISSICQEVKGSRSMDWDGEYYTKKEFDKKFGKCEQINVTKIIQKQELRDKLDLRAKNG